jgi:hypothetical protein
MQVLQSCIANLEYLKSKLPEFKGAAPQWKDTLLHLQHGHLMLMERNPNCTFTSEGHANGKHLDLKSKAH